MDENVVRTLNNGPMGPQGPVAVNHCIMNNNAGYKPVVRLFNLDNIHYEDEDSGMDTIEGSGAGISGDGPGPNPDIPFDGPITGGGEGVLVPDEDPDFEF